MGSLRQGPVPLGAHGKDELVEGAQGLGPGGDRRAQPGGAMSPASTMVR